MRVGTHSIGVLVMCAISLSGIGTAAAATAPSAAYTIEEEYTEKSPDGVIAIEQYVKKDPDDWKFQFWVRREGTLSPLDPELADYPAGFRFTNDSKWVVRSQKTGSGEQSLYLYHLAPDGSASRKELGDLAWAYMKTRPEWRKVVKAPQYHESANLLKGIQDNYRWLGVDWPGTRYLLISLSGEADVKGHKPMQTGVVRGWRCRYDLETGKFDVPSVFYDNNAKAVVPKAPWL